MLGPDWLDETALAGALTWESTVSSWYGGRWLADVPVESGQVTWSTRSEVPGVLNLTVPRLAAGRDWSPGRDEAHPLARMGQELVVTLTVGSPVSGRSWARRLGRFIIISTETVGGQVRVVARSLTQRMEDDRLTSPMPIRAAATLASEARRIVPPRLGLVTTGLTYRAAPQITWGESRIEALQEIAKAWPARLRETSEGQIALLPPLPTGPVPVVTLRDGEGGTVVGAPRTSTREGVYNRLVVRGTDSDDSGRPTVQVIHDHTVGALATHGEYGTVTRFFSSPLITTYAAADATAQTMLADSLRPSTTLPVTLAPDPRLELDDPVRVITEDGDDTGFISGLTIPLTINDGDMRLDVEVGA